MNRLTKIDNLSPKPPRAAHELIEFVIDYVENIRDRSVTPSVKPGYLQPLLPDRAPYLGENWDKIMPDIERCIMPGVSMPDVAAYLWQLGWERFSLGLIWSTYMFSSLKLQANLETRSSMRGAI